MVLLNFQTWHRDCQILVDRQRDTHTTHTDKQTHTRQKLSEVVAVSFRGRENGIKTPKTLFTDFWYAGFQSPRLLNGTDFFQDFYITPFLYPNFPRFSTIGSRVSQKSRKVNRSIIYNEKILFKTTNSWLPRLSSFPPATNGNPKKTKDWFVSKLYAIVS